MKILIDGNITAARDLFDPHGQVIKMDGRHIKREDLSDVDALVIRSVTQVNMDLLKNTPVRFVGTTTIGTDHLDIPWLEKSGITWASAPGCNADSAAQYSLAMAWLSCQRLGRNLEEQRVGIIGRGNVGSRVQKLMNAIGASTVANDPPLADAGETGLVSLDKALDQDIVCLHVPLTHSGSYPTYHLIDRKCLSQIRTGALLLNSARGDVIDGDALKQRLLSGQLNAALDVWPGEPDIDLELVSASLVATPHVAGYSEDGKRNGAIMIYKSFCDWAGETEHMISPLNSAERGLFVSADEHAVSKVLDTTCFVRKHDTDMRKLAQLPPGEAPKEFDRLRRDYPPRRDFHAWQVDCESSEAACVLRNLGFPVTEMKGAR